MPPPDLPESILVELRAYLLEASIDRFGTSFDNYYDADDMF